MIVVDENDERVIAFIRSIAANVRRLALRDADRTNDVQKLMTEGSAATLDMVANAIENGEHNQ